MASRRRTFLELLGGAGLGSLAGCTGSNDGSTETGTSKPGQGGDTATETESPTPEPEPIEGTLAGTLPAKSVGSGDELGSSVAVSDDGRTALAGAPKASEPNGFKSGAAYVFEYSDGNWSEQGQLAPDDGDPGDQLGSTVSLAADGTTALVGARYDEDPNGDEAGSAYVFERSDGTWSQQAKLSADDGEPQDRFGSTVALGADGTTALVGAYGAEVGGEEAAGAAYVFERSGDEWTREAKLEADDVESQDLFGTAVALGGDRALVGAIEDVGGARSAGAAYLFERSGGAWDRQAKVTADDGDEEDWFGETVALSADGTTALIGAVEDDDPNGYDEEYIFGGSGSAYVFEQSGGDWSQQAKLAADDGDPVDVFGWGVALGSEGNLAIVGAPWDEDPNGESGGSAYLFRRSGDDWDQREKLAPQDGESKDVFGWGVAASSNGSTALLGAPGSNASATSSGAVYLVD